MTETTESTKADAQNSAQNNSQNTQKLTFESALEQLQQTVKKLESGELSLDQSLAQFEDGVRLSRLCQEQLSAAEQRVEVLMKSSNPDQKPDTQPFHVPR